MTTTVFISVQLEDNAAFMDKYSRQIGAFGLEAMSKLMNLKVLIVGLRCVQCRILSPYIPYIPYIRLPSVCPWALLVQCSMWLDVEVHAERDPETFKTQKSKAGVLKTYVFNGDRSAKTLKTMWPWLSCSHRDNLSVVIFLRNRHTSSYTIIS